MTAGEASLPAVLLLHGFPSSARTFRDVIPDLTRVAHVIAPDLPGFGESDPPAEATFAALAEAVAELLAQLAVGPRFIYLHDFGAPVGLRIAMESPGLVRGLIIQNANAHRSGQGRGWAATHAYWSHPDADHEGAATAHLTLEGTRDQYVSGVPPEVAARIPPDTWQQDWRVMNLPGRLDLQRGLVRDYGNYTARFDEIAAWLAKWQPPALLLWGRHDVFFDLAEVQSWMHALPRMEAHILDGGHFLLETHAAPAAALMADFITRVISARTQTPGR